MSGLVVRNVKEVQGEVHISGAKNSILPLMCAALLSEKSLFTNTPLLRDTEILGNILQTFGVEYTHSDNEMCLEVSNLPSNIDITTELAAKIRYSTILMGALVGAGVNTFKLGLSGGCSSFGERPIDIHLDFFRNIGCRITEHTDHIEFDNKEIVESFDYTLRFPSVGATNNILISSAIMKKPCIVRNIAIEPEIIDLIKYLEKVGVLVEFISERDVRITSNRTNDRVSVEHRVISDRIEAISYIVLGAMHAKHELTVSNVELEYIKQPLAYLKSLGLDFDVKEKERMVVVKKAQNLDVKDLEVGVYPMIGTDYQPVIAMLLAYTAEKPVTIIDPIYPKRFRYLEEAMKVGLNAEVGTGESTIFSLDLKEISCHVGLYSHDLRAGFAMLLLAIFYPGMITVDNAVQVLRGYSLLEQKMKSIGIEIELV